MDNHVHNPSDDMMAQNVVGVSRCPIGDGLHRRTISRATRGDLASDTAGYFTVGVQTQQTVWYAFVGVFRAVLSCHGNVRFEVLGVSRVMRRRAMPEPDEASRRPWRYLTGFSHGDMNLATLLYTDLDVRQHLCSRPVVLSLV